MFWSTFIVIYTLYSNGIKEESLLILFPCYILSAESSSSEEEEEEEKEEDDKKPKTKTVKETTYEWELLNDVKAIWLRSPKEVTEEEYTKFYHSLAKVFSFDCPIS